ncbi:MAG: hypothetical protein ACRC8Z_10785 [Empedobacter falsenii]
MTPHDKAISIIEDFGIQPKKLAQILNVSVSAIYNKNKEFNGNRYSADDLEKIKTFYKTKLTALL